MIQLNPPALSAPTQQSLDTRQAAIDALPDYPQRVNAAKRAWKNKNSGRDNEAAITEVRRKLSDMSFGRRCHCCEDSCADEIEHMRPKDLFPDQTFRWDNYVYACGPCNGPKSNLLSRGTQRTAWHEIKRQRNTLHIPNTRYRFGDLLRLCPELLNL